MSGRDCSHSNGSGYSKSTEDDNIRELLLALFEFLNLESLRIAISARFEVCATIQASQR